MEHAEHDVEQECNVEHVWSMMWSMKHEDEEGQGTRPIRRRGMRSRRSMWCTRSEEHGIHS